LPQRGEFVGRGPALGVVATLVLLKILVLDSAVLANQPEGDFSRLQKFDHVRA